MKMEAIKLDTLPTSNSNSICLINSKLPETSDFISKEKEDELLYGEDDLDDDDELRLRLSDDEDNGQESTSSIQLANPRENSQPNDDDGKK